MTFPKSKTATAATAMTVFDTKKQRNYLFFYTGPGHPLLLFVIPASRN